MHSKEVPNSLLFGAEPNADTIELLMAHHNKRAVFCDSGVLGLCVVDDITICLPFLRLRLELCDLVTLGRPAEFGICRTMSVGGNWDDITVRPDVWICQTQGASWRLIPNELSFAAVQQFCAAEPDLDPDVRFYLARYVANHPTTGAIPAEVRAQAVQWVESGTNHSK
jgi:hypothetical protein